MKSVQAGADTASAVGRVYDCDHRRGWFTAPPSQRQVVDVLIFPGLFASPPTDDGEGEINTPEHAILRCDAHPSQLILYIREVSAQHPGLI
jgi:hypothetical protein